MRLPRMRLSVRALLALVVLVAIVLASSERLFLGDGGVDFEIVNVMNKPIRNLRLSCKGRSIAVDILPSGSSIRGRLWPATYGSGGRMMASFGLAYSVDGQVKNWNDLFTFDLFAQEPSVRLEMGERNGEEAWDFKFPHVAISPTRLQLRKWWFRVFPLRW